MLELEGLRVSYGEIEALQGVSLSVAEGEIVTLIGANGAGKTTSLKAISGLLRPSAGAIRFRGEPLAGLPPHRRMQLGICHVPEGRHVFPAMTVFENLEMGAFLRTRRRSSEFRADLDGVYELFPVLAERQAQLAGTLSGGEQQMLAIGRALMGQPRLLLLDEPSLGLAPLVVIQMFSVFADIRARGITFLLVEQNANQALKIADRAYVLEAGRITRSGEAAQLLGDDAIKAAYLGGNVAA